LNQEEKPLGSSWKSGRFPADDLYWTFVEAFAVEHSQSLRSLASPPLASSYPLLLILQDLMNQKA